MSIRNNIISISIVDCYKIDMNTKSLSILILSILSLTITKSARPSPTGQDVNKNVNLLLGNYENTFENLLVNISKKTKKCIICDPLIMESTLEDLESRPIFSKPNLTNSEYIKIFCEFYGYKVSESASGNLIFTKNFDTKNHIPNLTYDEILASLSRLEKIRETIILSNSFTRPLADFVNTLSSEQITSLKQGTEIGRLSKNQQNLIRSFCFSAQYIMFKDVDSIIKRIRGCKKPKTFFSFQNLYGESLPTYNGYFNAEDSSALYTVVLSRWVYTQSGGGTICDNRYAKLDREGNILNIGADPTNPNLKNKLIHSSISKKIGDFYDEGYKYSHKKITLDKSLRSRRIIVLGNKNMDFDNVMLDIAESLHSYVKTHNDIVSINYLPPIDYTDLHKFKDNVISSLPYDFFKCAQLEKIFASKNTYLALTEANLIYSNGIYISSIKRLREIIQPKFENSKEKKLQLLNFSDNEFNLIALSSLCTLLPSLIQVGIDDLPAYLIDDDDYSRSTLKIELEEVPKSENGDAGLKVTLQIRSKKSGGFSVETMILHR